MITIVVVVVVVIIIMSTSAAETAMKLNEEGNKLNGQKETDRKVF